MEFEKEILLTVVVVIALFTSYYLWDKLGKTQAETTISDSGDHYSNSEDFGYLFRF